MLAIVSTVTTATAVLALSHLMRATLTAVMVDVATAATRTVTVMMLAIRATTATGAVITGVIVRATIHLVPIAALGTAVTVGRALLQGLCHP